MEHVIYEDQVSPVMYIGAAIALGFIGFFGFTANLLVAIVIVKDAQILWTPVNVILFNLVVSDDDDDDNNNFSLSAKFSLQTFFFFFFLILCYSNRFVCVNFLLKRKFKFIKFEDGIFAREQRV